MQHQRKEVKKSMDDVKWNGFAKKTFTPIFEGIVVQVIPPDLKEGDLFLPETIRNERLGRPIEAYVIACGPLVRTMKIGQLIVMGNHPMISFTTDGKNEVCCTTESFQIGTVDEEDSDVQERAKEILGDNYANEMIDQKKRLDHHALVEKSKEYSHL